MKALRSATWLLWLFPSVFLGLFYAYPLAVVAYTSLNPANFYTALTELIQPATLSIISFTFWQAILSTALTVLAGLPVAWLFARFRFPGRGLLRALTGVPFVLPTVVVAAAFNVLLGPNGWFAELTNAIGLGNFDLRYTLAIIIIAHVFYNLTVVIRLVGDFWANLDPQLVEVARTLGANRWRAFWQVSLPLLAPAVFTAAAFVFIFNFTSFGVVLILGGPQFSTLEVEIYRQTLNFNNLPLAALLSGLQLLFTLALAVIYTMLTRRLSQPLRLRAARDLQRPLRTPSEWSIAIILLTALLLFQGLPLLALVWRSLHTESGFSLAYYAELWVNRRQSIFFVSPIVALGQSFRNAALTVLLALGLGLPTAMALAQRRPGHRLFEPLLLLPLGTSAVTLGLGFVLAFGQDPFNWRTSPLLLPLAHTLVAFPFVVRSLLPALRSIQPQLQQTAATLGASPRRVWLTVDLPLITRAMLVAAAFAFALSLGEFGATALLARPELPTAPIAIFRFLGQPGALNYGQALALSTLLMLACGGAILAIESFRVGELGEF